MESLKPSFSLLALQRREEQVAEAWLAATARALDPLKGTEPVRTGDVSAMTQLLVARRREEALRPQTPAWSEGDGAGAAAGARKPRLADALVLELDKCNAPGGMHGEAN